jgi:polyisoprenoid-binding protein YceI
MVGVVEGVAEGVHALGPESGRLLVETTRAGLGAKVGHDLIIEVTRWRGEATVSADPAQSSVRLEVDADSLEVRRGTGGVKPLTDGDRAEIEATIRDKILRAGRHPTITFRSNRITGTAESFQVAGELTIAGATRPITVRARLAEGRVNGSATIVQSHWGIRPYTAFFGALKIKDEVQVRFDIGLTEPPASH